MALRQEELTSLCDDVDLDRDRALVERCQAGDTAAFGNLYARYYERLLRFCLRRLNDRHEAEDAAQEAFARAWKALPRFAGERRFYPWLTVIAGNICTDMVRRRARSTPTDDLELTAQPPVGVVGEDTSEDLVLAAVDGELVHRALGRLSTRHRLVLAMREGSGWTYQQIADHEGVEIGTIETLLWRARQALKREFTVVSDSKGALAGFLVAAGAVVRRTVFRVAHRHATLQPQGGGTGVVRDAVLGVAVTGAALAVAIVAPHALAPRPSTSPSAPGSALAAPSFVFAPVGASHTTNTATSGAAAWAQPNDVRVGPGSSPQGSAASSGNIAAPVGSAPTVVQPGAAPGASSIPGQAATGQGGAVSGLANGLNQRIGGVTGGLANGVSGVTSTVNGVVGGVAGATSGASGAVGGAASGLTNELNGLTQSLGMGNLPSATPPGSSTTGSSGTPTTTTTTAPGVLGGLLGG